MSTFLMLHIKPNQIPCDSMSKISDFFSISSSVSFISAMLLQFSLNETALYIKSKRHFFISQRQTQ